MSDEAHESGGAGPSHRSAEIGVIVVMAAVSLIGIYGSLQVGVGWAAEGPQAGFFPFYCLLLVLIGSAVNLFHVFRDADRGVFAAWPQLRQVMAVVVPTAVYVAIIPFIGIYVSSALLIAIFMIWLGRYSWMYAVPIAVAVPVLIFLTFEFWFLVPLPKGPFESLFY